MPRCHGNIIMSHSRLARSHLWFYLQLTCQWGDWVAGPARRRALTSVSPGPSPLRASWESVQSIWQTAREKCVTSGQFFRNFQSNGRRMYFAFFHDFQTIFYMCVFIFPASLLHVLLPIMLLALLQFSSTLLLFCLLTNTQWQHGRTDTGIYSRTWNLLALMKNENENNMKSLSFFSYSEMSALSLHWPIAARPSALWLHWEWQNGELIPLNQTLPQHGPQAWHETGTPARAVDTPRERYYTINTSIQYQLARHLVCHRLVLNDSGYVNFFCLLRP